MNSSVVKWPLFLATLLISYWFFNHYILATTVTMGESMYPTLQSGEFRVVNKFIYHMRTPKRGEIVVLNLPESGELLVKRVIGVENDVIQFKNGAVFLNGTKLSEPYLPPTVTTEPDFCGNLTIKIKPHSYFVLGDNRDVSLDSRTFGMVRKDWIIGKVGS
ncbi:MAG: signal peptidase I [Chitinivibrionales bacterium]|nr:signal peptidase I [Chitinivibrionales bacterium]